MTSLKKLTMRQVTCKKTDLDPYKTETMLNPEWKTECDRWITENKKALTELFMKDVLLSNKETNQSLKNWSINAWLSWKCNYSFLDSTRPLIKDVMS